MGEHGIHTILPTPFGDGGELDILSLQRLVDFQLEAGVQRSDWPSASISTSNEA